MMVPQTAPMVYFFGVLPTETYNLVGLRHKKGLKPSGFKPFDIYSRKRKLIKTGYTE